MNTNASFKTRKYDIYFQRNDDNNLFSARMKCMTSWSKEWLRARRIENSGKMARDYYSFESYDALRIADEQKVIVPIGNWQKQNNSSVPSTFWRTFRHYWGHLQENRTWMTDPEDGCIQTCVLKWQKWWSQFSSTSVTFFSIKWNHRRRQLLFDQWFSRKCIATTKLISGNGVEIHPSMKIMLFFIHYEGNVQRMAGFTLNS